MSYLGFLGMSGAGKSYWSKQLAAEEWQCIDIDDLIYKRLAKELNCTFSDKYEAGKWLGLPNETTYPERAALFRHFEFMLLSEIADDLEQGRVAPKTVFDFGGSIIYVGNTLMQRLSQRLIFVYLQVAESVYQQMCNVYLQNPIAVIWDGQFLQNEGETLGSAFAHSYPRLIQSRIEVYEKYAQKTIPYHWHRSPNCSVKAFLKEIGYL